MDENFFTDYSEMEREKILSIGKIMSYPKEAIIYREGEPGFGFFIVLKGSVSLNRKDQASQKRVSLLKNGQFFGEIDVMQSNRRLTNALVEEAGEFLLITRSNFDVLIKINPITSLKIMRTMAERLKKPLDELDSVPEKGSESPKGARLLAFFSSANHIGKTSLSINLGGFLSGILKKKVCLIDLDLQFGDIHFVLFPQVKGRYRTIGELVQEEDWSPQLVNAYLSTHEPSGMKILPAPIEPEQSELVDVPSLKKILFHLSGQFDYILVDTHSTLSDINMTLIEEANTVVMAVTPNPIHIQGLKKTLTLFETLYTQRFFQKLQILVNRTPSGSKPGFMDLHFPVRPKTYLPLDPEVFNKTVLEGVIPSMDPPNSKAVRALIEWGCLISGENSEMFLKQSFLNKALGWFSN